MEVKIKQGEEMLDATIEMVDGVMVVSPKEVKFEPKDGDVVHCTNSICSYVAIFRNISECGQVFYRYAVLIDSEELKINMNGFDYSDYSNPRPATEEEKKKLFDKLAEEGYEFDFDKKEFVKLKWKPKEGVQFWFPLYYTCPAEFKPITSFLNKERDKAILDKGWCFKTEEECQVFCNRLNSCILSIKP
jgi:hypothetical protein